jgi:hypothetical protein
MKTWKSKRKVCRSRKRGRFARKGLCAAFKTQLVRIGGNTLFR